MKLASIRIITDDLDRMVAFYETVTELTAERPRPSVRRARVSLGHAGDRSLADGRAVR